MKSEYIEITWPNGNCSKAIEGGDWLKEAKKEDITIPTGCLTGSCGACEIEVNGEVVRACISNIPTPKNRQVKVEFIDDPYW